ncbi:predicted protein [Nematostella vectensis]|uniref:NACHT domain-containing protein n=1 Tax=Nematostella vectensis TaxID=45351 RepID=A7STJ6_NEMVE|nr:predicted protein [Nematostella vectensis]|eukprot:XP_001625054.1 predicted protein [Nematostella vectensis]
MGMWKIQVTAMGQTYERTFEVKEYVLPKFKVSVTLPPYATKKGLEEDSLKGAIDVKYTYGKGVEGTANISLGFDRFKMIQLTRTKDLTVKGSSSFYFTKREIEDLFKQQYPWSQPQYLYSSRWYSLVVNATFEEKLTGRKASGESTISFFSSDVKLEFPSFNPNSFKPGLLFDAVLQVTQPDGSPLSPTRQQDMKVTIHRRFTYGEYESADAYTPKDGVIVIQIDVPSNATIVSLLAKYKDDINNKDEYGEQAYLNAEKALSPSSSYLQLQTSTPAVKLQTSTPAVKLLILTATNLYPSSKVITHFIECLCEKYTTGEMALIEPLENLEEHDFSLDSMFTEPKIVKKDTDLEVKMNSMFVVDGKVKKACKVLLEGDSGAGKTTLTKKLASDWAKGVLSGSSTFPEVELLLVLKCSEMKEGNQGGGIFQAIQEQLLPDEITVEERLVIFQYIKHNQGKVMVILDGFDEIPSQANSVKESLNKFFSVPLHSLHGLPN